MSILFSNKKRQIAANEEVIEKYKQTLVVQTERINELKSELVKASADILKYKTEEDSIKLALKNAVDKAAQIESSAKALYSLEIERLKLLYKKWEQLLNAAVDEKQRQAVSASMSDFAKQANAAIANTFKQDFNLNFELPTPEVVKDKNTDNASVLTRQFVSLEDKQNVRMLLEKMLKQASQNNLKPVKMEISTKGAQEKTPKNVIIRKPNVSVTPEKKPAENLGMLHNNLSTQNNSGFDLKEALNPIGDLEEIMKGFDFFDEIDN